MKLTFADQLKYKRGEGFQTANLALPFKVLGDFLSGEMGMVHLDGANSNELFDTLADWTVYLDQNRSSFTPEGP